MLLVLPQHSGVVDARAKKDMKHNGGFEIVSLRCLPRTPLRDPGASKPDGPPSEGDDTKRDGLDKRRQKKKEFGAGTFREPFHFMGRWAAVFVMPRDTDDAV